ncbi:MAG: hypothetical protein WBP85_01110, partial [Terracidiphilus sp.]
SNLQRILDVYPIVIDADFGEWPDGEIAKKEKDRADKCRPIFLEPGSQGGGSLRESRFGCRCRETEVLFKGFHAGTFSAGMTNSTRSPARLTRRGAEIA